MISIPTISDGSQRSYTQGVRLDGADYWLTLAWNSRLEHWLVSLYLADGTAVIEGSLCVLWTDLLRGVVVTGRPPGVLFTYPVDGVMRHAGLQDLGTRVLLAYRTQDEVASD